MDAAVGIDLVPEGPVRRMVAAANRHDLDEMVSQFAEDYENITPAHPARSFIGAAQVRKNWAALFAGLADLLLIVHNATTGPGGTVWMEWGTRGTLPDGSMAASAGVAILTVRDDRILASRFYLEPVDNGSADADDAIRAALSSGNRGGEGT